MKIFGRLTNKRVVRLAALIMLLATAFTAGMICKDQFISDAWAPDLWTTKEGTFIIPKGNYEGILDGKTVTVIVKDTHLYHAYFQVFVDGGIALLRLY